MIPYGCRKVKVFTNVTEAEIDRHGAYGYLEITNLTGGVVGTPIAPGETPEPMDPNAGTVWVTVNAFPEQGHVGTKIPIPYGTTRQIPMAVYKFTATGPVDVIAYGL